MEKHLYFDYLIIFYINTYKHYIIKSPSTTTGTYTSLIVDIIATTFPLKKVNLLYYVVLTVQKNVTFVNNQSNTPR